MHDEFWSLKGLNRGSVTYIGGGSDNKFGTLGNISSWDQWGHFDALHATLKLYSFFRKYAAFFMVCSMDEVVIKNRALPGVRYFPTDPGLRGNLR